MYLFSITEFRIPIPCLPETPPPPQPPEVCTQTRPRKSTYVPSFLNWRLFLEKLRLIECSSLQGNEVLRALFANQVPDRTYFKCNVLNSIIHVQCGNTNLPVALHIVTHVTNYVIGNIIFPITYTTDVADLPHMKLLFQNLRSIKNFSISSDSWGRSTQL